MRWRLADLDGARVALIGYGREGRAVERVLAHRAPGAAVTVFAESAPEIEPEAPLVLGPLAVDPTDFDVVLRSPGVRPDHPGLAACRAAGLPMTTSSSIWFAERGDACTVAVTGSKGKSTTSSLLAHLLAGDGRRVELAGNIGRPLLELLDASADVFVIELSSYQLVDLDGRPDHGVITRLFPEHVDWHGSIEAYYAAKLRLVALLDGNPLWFNATDPVLEHAVGSAPNARPANRPPRLHARDDGVYRGETRLFERSAWSLPGRHNLDNLALALAVAGELGLDSAAALSAARAFRGLPHRLESLGRIGDVDWVNDSISTSPHATRAALDADARPAVLIAGGQDRGADWSVLNESTTPLRGLVGLPDTGEALCRCLVQAGRVAAERVRRADDMEAAVRAAVELAEPGDRVLLSPGAPSYHRFRDFEARGNSFRAAVAALREASGDA